MSLPLTVFRVVQRLALLLPRRVGLVIANIIGDVCYLCISGARRQALRNTFRVLSYDPDSAAPRPVKTGYLRRSVRYSFRNQAANYLDLLRLPAQTTAALDALIRVEGLQHVYDALAGGKGMVLVTCHLGLMDFGPLVLATRGQKVIAPVEPMKDKAMFEFLSGLRTSQGYEVIASEPKIMRYLLKSLRDNAVLAIVADRDFQKNGIPVTFFGKETHMPAGPAVLALRTRAPLVFAICIRQPDTSYLATVYPPLQIEHLRDDDFERSVQRVMQEIAVQFERAIQKHPEHWASFHTIWHT